MERIKWSLRAQARRPEDPWIDSVVPALHPFAHLGVSLGLPGMYASTPQGRGGKLGMQRVILAVIGAIFAALVFAAPASAITYGTPDGNGHPEVGALLAPKPYSDGTWETCSGTLISPTVFLTAAHCDQGVSRVAVTFDSSYNAATGTTYWGTWHADPNYNQAQSDPQDVAVVIFDKAVKGITPARLPKAGSLSNLSVGTRFTSVGYGAQSVTIDQGPTFHYADIRYVATGGLEALNPSWLRISMNPALGDGGTCYGDSGGPNFLGAGATETNIVAGTTITGDFMCRATNVDYRMDTPSARAFLGQYVTLP
jgi:Trypsin